MYKKKTKNLVKVFDKQEMKDLLVNNTYKYFAGTVYVSAKYIRKSPNKTFKMEAFYELNNLLYDSQPYLLDFENFLIKVENVNGYFDFDKWLESLETTNDFKTLKITKQNFLNLLQNQLQKIEIVFSDNNENIKKLSTVLCPEEDLISLQTQICEILFLEVRSHLIRDYNKKDN